MLERPPKKLWHHTRSLAGISVYVVDRCQSFKMNSGARDAAQTGHKRQATKTGRHVVTQGSLGDGGQGVGWREATTAEL